MKQTLQDMKVSYDKTIPIICDNTSEIRISKKSYSSLKNQAYPPKVPFSYRKAG